MIGSIEPGNRTRGLPKTHGVLDRLDDSHCEGIRGVETVGRLEDRAKTASERRFAPFRYVPFAFRCKSHDQKSGDIQHVTLCRKRFSSQNPLYAVSSRLCAYLRCHPSSTQQIVSLHLRIEFESVKCVDS